MARSVENPFKDDRRAMWVHYLIVSLSCLTVLWIVSSVLQAPTPRKEMNIRWTERPPPPKFENHGSAADDGEAEVETEAELEAEETEAPPDDNSEEKVFPSDLTLLDYPEWLHTYYQSLTFETHLDLPSRQLTKEILEKSLSLGCDNMVSNMRPEGNFNYQYDFVKKQLDDMAVRQAGALWGLTMCWQHHPDNHMWRVAVEKGIDFYASHMVDGEDDIRYIQYPEATESESGANALFGLALIEYLRTIQDHPDQVQVDDAKTRVQTAQELLQSVIDFLKYMQMDDHHFSQGYRIDQKRKRNYSSPYYDGESMLCFIKAAKYLKGYDDLIPIIEEAAPIMAKAYTVDAWAQEHDSDETKGFYQWSSMVFTEYYQARYKDFELFGDYVIVLGHWIIHTHEILDRAKNTGYAYEGIISAYTVAKAREHKTAIVDFAYTIDKGLYRLTQWQVAGPLANLNPFLLLHPTDEKIAIGGIMNGRTDSTLRIDTTQHQMHALMMASSLVYNS
jgi:hypothetical protein